MSEVPGSVGGRRAMSVRVDAQVAREDRNQALDEANTAFYTTLRHYPV